MQKNKKSKLNLRRITSDKSVLIPVISVLFFSEGKSRKADKIWRRKRQKDGEIYRDELKKGPTSVDGDGFCVRARGSTLPLFLASDSHFLRPI